VIHRKFWPFKCVQDVFSKLTVLHVTAKQPLWDSLRGTSVGPFVAVNIDFCEHFRLLCIIFYELQGGSNMTGTDFFF